MSEQIVQEERKLQRYYLEIQRSIEVQMGTLIVDARNLIDTFLAQSGDSWKMTATQASNLLGVCMEAAVVEEVTGYIQYQIGRDKAKETGAWRSRDEPYFGEELIKHLKGLEEKSTGIVDDAFSILPEGTHVQKEHEQARVWLALAQQYVGHLRRYLVYKRGV